MFGSSKPTMPSPDTGSMPITVDPGAPEEVRDLQAEMPAMAAVTEPRQKPG